MARNFPHATQVFSRFWGIRWCFCQQWHWWSHIHSELWSSCSSCFWCEPETVEVVTEMSRDKEVSPSALYWFLLRAKAWDVSLRLFALKLMWLAHLRILSSFPFMSFDFVLLLLFFSSLPVSSQCKDFCVLERFIQHVPANEAANLWNENIVKKKLGCLSTFISASKGYYYLCLCCFTHVEKCTLNTLIWHFWRVGALSNIGLLLHFFISSFCVCIS